MQRWAYPLRYSIVQVHRLHYASVYSRDLRTHAKASIRLFKDRVAPTTTPISLPTETTTDISTIPTRTRMIPPTVSTKAVESSPAPTPIPTPSSVPSSRSTIKLQTLMQTKAKVDSCWMRFSVALQDSSSLEKYSPPMLQSMQTEYIQRLDELTLAYTQAIKYLARTREKDSASKAQGILNEWLQRIHLHSSSSTSGTVKHKSKSPDNADKKNRDLSLLTPCYMHQVLKDMTTHSSSSTTTEASLSLPPSSSPSFSYTLSPPTHKDFHNVLHAWANSKAKKKGFMAQQVLYHMTTLVPSLIPASTKTTLLPDTKAMALAIKCFATSTLPQAFHKVMELHQIHDLLLQYKIPGNHVQDPYFLMYSIKTVKNYKKRNETHQLMTWLESLTEWVVQSDPIPWNSQTNNKGMMPEEDLQSEQEEENEEEEEDALETHSPLSTFVDLTPMYNNIIRNFFYIRGEPHVAEKLYQVFQHMHKIQRHQLLLFPQGKTCPATLEIKQNAYNMILASYGNAKDEFYMIQGMKMLEDMIQTWKSDQTTTTSTVSLAPLPNDQSFVYGLGLLRNEKSMDKVLKESSRLLNHYESIMDASTSGNNPVILDPSPKVYNACMDLYTHTMEGQEVLSACCTVMDRMRDRSKKDIQFTPNMDSYAMLIKACSLVTGDYIETIRAHEMATATFTTLKQGPDSSQITDSIYFYMMKCVAMHVTEKEEKQTTMIQLFEQACKKGLLSANVLRVFKMNVPENVFTEKVGHGRLADKWVANVTTEKALYTDGTSGGEGKNARRKGKSTSEWLKKQKLREEEIRRMKAAKVERKRFKGKKVKANQS